MTDRIHHYTARSTPPSIALIQAVAHVQGIDPLDMDPIPIDLDALDRLLEYSDTVTFSFSTHGLTVTIEGSGDITIVQDSTQES